MTKQLSLIDKPKDTLQYATFHVGDLFFGIEAVKVQEVLRYHEITEIPLAPAAIVGLINLRGQIVTAIDTRRVLGLAASDKDTLPMNIVIHSDDGAVSLLVDEIGDVLDVPLNLHAPAPENMLAQHRSLIDGVYKLRNNLMLALNTERLLQTFCN